MPPAPLLARPLAALLAAAVLLAGCGGDECSGAETRCSDDGLTLRTCAGGRWRATACMAEQGQLCEGGACVDPWRYGAPAWSRCDGEPLATPESLGDKARAYDERARRLHLHPALRWVTPVTLPCRVDPCPPGGTPPCYDCTAPAVAETEATWTDVETFHTGENDGLWSALFLAAEAYRYGVTRDPAALEVIRVLLAGEVDRMRITGVPGLFTRQLIPPGVAGIGCPADPTQYVPSADKKDNRWVRVGDDGCVATVDPATGAWVASTHCGLDDYRGWCWLDNVSKDEYAGHMFALGALLALVDDAAVQTVTRDLLGQVGRHLAQHRLTLVDWDGRVTEHGRFYAYAMDDWPSFNAAMALAFMRLAATATGDPELVDWYDNCLLQQGGPRDCLEQPLESPRPYVDHLSPQWTLYIGAASCQSNWNNFSMHALSLHDLLWFEHDPAVRAPVQRHLQDDFFAPKGKARPLSAQHNSLFDFIFAAGKALGPGSDGPALAAVADGVCMLRQFPAEKHARAVTCPPEKCVLASCTDRFDGPMLDYARPVAERCLGTFVWWGSPYDPGDCAADLRVVDPPTDYLLAYWMARYYGFVGEDE
ncbi:MAG TPA: hypothetical protein VGQ83_09815 [Polyangia bacterium]|jgi:hypothetical protein